MYRRLSLAALLGAAVACSSSNSPTAPSPTPSPTPTPTATPTPSPTPTPVPSAQYRVTFEATWSAATHPQDFPSNPHFSPLIGGNHDGSIRFWSEGATATTGIKNMAEMGQGSPFDDEFAAAIGAGRAQQFVAGPGIGRSPGSTSVTLDVAPEYPLLTVVSMLAPSPDWFVGVSALSLLDGSQWRDSFVIELLPWDAGTDDGASYESPDQPAPSRRPIARITGAPLAHDGRVAPVGRLVVTRLR